MKKHLPTILKACVTLALLAVIFHAIHPREIIQRVRQAAPGWMVATFLLSLVSPVLVAFKWRILLRRAGVRAPVLTLLNIVLMSGFIGTFLPSNLGVDALRMYALHRRGINVAANASSLLCERLLGVLALVGFALVAVLPAWHTLGQHAVLVQVAVLSAGLIGLILLFLSERCFAWGRRLLAATLNTLFRADSRFAACRAVNRVTLKVVASLGDIHATLRGQFSHPATLLPVAALTLAVQFLRIVQVHLLFRSVGTAVPWAQELTFVPIILLLSLLPIAVFGIGIKEGAFLYFFKQVGVDPAVTLAVAFYTYVLQIMIIIPGSLVFLYERRAGQRNQPAADPLSPSQS